MSLLSLQCKLRQISYSYLDPRSKCLLLARARSGSILGEPSPGLQRHFQSGSPIEENPFPMLSEAEEADMQRARRSGFRDEVGSDDERDHHEGQHYEQGDEDENMGGRSMGSSGYDSHRRLIPDEGVRHRPDGMAQPARNRYDFKAMEEFAEQERKDLDLPAEGGRRSMNGQEGMRQRRNGAAGSEEELAPQSYDTAMERTATMSAFGDEPESTAFSPKESESAHGNNGFHRRRQRKLSQSNPVLRRGGRLALFEGIGSHSTPEEGAIPDPEASAPVPFKSRAPKNPLTAATGNSFAPYTDTPAGHDRPYRFSFYSNNLPVTIHARTLAELPAEGQTFEDLFKGRATMDETRGVPADGSTPHKGSVDSSLRRNHTGSGVETPERDPNMAQPNGKMSLLAKAAGAASKGAGPGQGGSPEHDPEAFTWWMDVHSPTDEEMRMLSKVCHIP
jgi:magnesium transporter